MAKRTTIEAAGTLPAAVLAAAATGSSDGSVEGAIAGQGGADVVNGGGAEGSTDAGNGEGLSEGANQGSQGAANGEGIDASQVALGAGNGGDGGAEGGGIAGDDEGGPEMQQPILVRSVAAKGRWRIGMHFTREPILLDAAELDDDQKARLSGDLELIIQVVD